MPDLGHRGGPARDVLAEVRGFPSPGGAVDVDVRVGDVLHLRGGNGSGKTSLLRALAGLDAPLRPAKVSVLGHDPRTLGAPALARTVRAVWASAREGLAGLTVAGEFRLRAAAVPPALRPLADRDVASLSTGEAHRVALAAAAAAHAPLLLLDEPCAALDSDGRAGLAALVRDAARAGAVVIADHSGWAAGLATASLDLGGHGVAVDLVLPRAGEAPQVLAASGTTVRRGTRDVALPPVRLGPGFHAVTGPNGAGKSTLLARLSGLRDAEGVAVAGAAPEPGRSTRLLQSGAGELLMAETVQAELADAVDPEGLVPSRLLGRHPMSLSAGEAQRVALVKVLGRGAPLHLLDEPDAHLDADARWRMLAAVARRLADGSCVVAATHDATLVAAAHSRVEVGA